MSTKNDASMQTTKQMLDDMNVELEFQVRQSLRDYLQTMRSTSKPGPLLPRLKDVFADPDESLYEHLTQVAVPRPRAQSPK